MYYRYFKEQIEAKIANFLPEEYADARFIFNMVPKNGIVLDGVTLLLPDSRIGPTVYLQPAYAWFMQHEDMLLNDVIQKLVDILVEHANPVVDTQSITDFEKAKNKIVPKFINKESSKELLNKVANNTYADLAVVYIIIIDDSEEVFMSVTITNNLLRSWNITKEELHSIAIENMKHIYKPMFVSANELFAGMDPSIPANVDTGMYLLTNKKMQFGAVEILNDEFMDSIISEFGEDFYVLPSSIHELIILPYMDDDEDSKNFMKTLVHDVNNGQVEVEDRLSYNIYKYDKNKRTIYIV